jgi:hypothetical protein
MARVMLGSAVVRRRLWLWLLIGGLAFLVVATVAVVAAVPLTSDALRHRMIDTLSSRLDADVSIGDLHWRVFPTVHATGSNLTLRRRGRGDALPLISIKRFTVDARLAGLVRKRVQHVTVEGLEIAVPPSDDAPGAEASPAPTATGASARPPLEEGVVIETLDADGARVLTIPRNKNKAPRVWAIHSLRLHNVGSGQAMPFRAALTNAVPTGDIDTTGTFGPWVPDEPGDTAIAGTFTFGRADLSVFRGISGTLSARGNFGGTLDRIDVTGETETPDFTLRLSGQPFPLLAKYHTIVDGTNGDTILERIDATFIESSLSATGSVVDGPPGAKGRVVTLDITMDRARIEDVMRMTVKGDPPMRGALKLKTKFVLPPGDADVVDKLRLDGEFSVARVRFHQLRRAGKNQRVEPARPRPSRSARGSRGVGFPGTLPPRRRASGAADTHLRGARRTSTARGPLCVETGNARLSGPAADGREGLANTDGRQVVVAEGCRSAVQPARRRQRHSDPRPRPAERPRPRHRHGPRLQARR